MNHTTSSDRLDEMHEDVQWQEFSAKMRALYSLVYDAQSSDVAYPWVTYWFSGMTEDEIYDLALKGFAKYKAGDTLYVLQGRDENGKRSFRNSNATILLGSREETLFCNRDNEAQMKRMTDEKMTVADILNTFAIKKKAGENGFDFNTGFVDRYAGYHTHV